MQVAVQNLQTRPLFGVNDSCVNHGCVSRGGGKVRLEKPLCSLSHLRRRWQWTKKGGVPFVHHLVALNTHVATIAWLSCYLRCVP